jgi:site-specific DNA-methyltransferase (adenine-specific)
MSVLPEPYWSDDSVTLYHGDAREILPHLTRVDAIITDPPYGETSLAWDRWPDGWVSLAATIATQMWCFGSFRMFSEKGREFLEYWKLAQDVIWEKHNGSNAFADRFRRVHELAVHFYRGEWSALHVEPQFTNDATARTVRRKRRPPQWGHIEASAYRSEDGGPRLMNSVIYARSCHGDAVHPTQKPEAIVQPLMLYSVPTGGLVVDCFAGSGTVLQVARMTGRRAIGIEIDEKYCSAIAERLAQHVLIA